MAEFFKPTVKKLNMSNDGNKDLSPNVANNGGKQNNGMVSKDHSKVPAIAESVALGANKPNDGKWTANHSKVGATGDSAAKKGSGR